MAMIGCIEYVRQLLRKRCNHEGYYISRGDGGYCLRCGAEDTVFGVSYWVGKAKPIVEDFYRGKINYSEIDKQFEAIGGTERWRREPTLTRRWDEK